MSHIVCIERASEQELGSCDTCVLLEAAHRLLPRTSRLLHRRGVGRHDDVRRPPGGLTRFPGEGAGLAREASGARPPIETGCALGGSAPTRLLSSWGGGCPLPLIKGCARCSDSGFLVLQTRIVQSVSTRDSSIDSSRMDELLKILLITRLQRKHTIIKPILESSRAIMIEQHARCMICICMASAYKTVCVRSQSHGVMFAFNVTTNRVVLHRTGG